MTKSSYAEKLKDSRWLMRKNEIFAIYGFTCYECGVGHAVQVHHRYYIPGRDPWDYPDFALIPVCSDHHLSIHEAQNSGQLMAWEKMVAILLANKYVPTENDLLCAICRCGITDENSNGSRMGKHEFLCKACESSLENGGVADQ